jgi:hypothetical protein
MWRGSPETLSRSHPISTSVPIHNVNVAIPVAAMGVDGDSGESALLKPKFENVKFARWHLSMVTRHTFQIESSITISTRPFIGPSIFEEGYE